MTAPRASALYEGVVRHERHTPRRHRFAVRLALPYIDLAELPGLFEGRWLYSVGRRNVAWFRREDYMAPHDVPLDEAVRRRVQEALGVRPRGAIRMLAHVRTLGWCFNPVTFYWCFDERDEPAFLVAEITNTPWGERFAHVLDLRPDQGATPGRSRHGFAKRFHVSPFLPMDLDYVWAFRHPGRRLQVHMRCRRAGHTVLEATLGLRRRSWDGAALRRLLVRHPLMTWRVSLAIYVQALRLWLKRVPFHAHPPTERALP